MKKKRRKSSKRNKRRRILKRILQTSAIVVAILTAVILLAVFAIKLNSSGRTEDLEKMAVTEDDRKEHEGYRVEKRGEQNKGEKEKKTSKKKSGHENGQSASETEEEVAETNPADLEGGRENDIHDYIESMTLEEKIAQLFVVTPESLANVENVLMAGEKTQEAINQHPVGGIVYFRNNITSEEQFVEMARRVQAYSMERTGLPLFICIDEEGGTVSRISGRGFAEVPDIEDMCQIGADGDSNAAYEVGLKIGEYLSRFQINVDFAPVADVYSNPKNTVIGSRAFGSTPKLVADMVASEVRGLKEKKVASTLKHFPGHGDTAEDSHSGLAYSYKTIKELRECELVPFEAGIDAGAEFVMVGHISLPNVLGSNTPASLSYTMITEVLREELGFDGIIITDSLNMDAISENYTPAEAAVYAVQAGADMLLMSQNFISMYGSLLDAVKQEKITEKRINESLVRILKLKRKMQDAQ